MKSVQHFWNSGPLAKVFVALGAGGVLAGVCGVCVVCAIVLTSTPTSRTTAQVDATPTRTTRPAATANVPATPQPTAIPTPAWNAKELAAFESLNTNALVIEDAVSVTVALAGTPKFTDDAWTKALDAQRSRMTEAGLKIDNTPISEESLGNMRLYLSLDATTCEDAATEVWAAVQHASQKELASAATKAAGCLPNVEAQRKSLLKLRDGIP